MSFASSGKPCRVISCKVRIQRMAKKRTVNGRYASWISSRLAALAGGDECEGEAVVALCADGLESGGGEAGQGSELFEEETRSLHVWIGAGRIDHGAIADDVIHNDESAATRKLQRPAKVFGVIRFVRVDENQVEGLRDLGLKFWKGIKRWADTNVDDVRETGASEPDGAVTAERADFQNVSRAYQ